jgi:hypothetical protein
MLQPYVLNSRTGSFATTSSNTFNGTQTVVGNVIVQGNLTAQQYILSSSVIYITESFSSGSTIFGNTLDDTHQMTGSFLVTGSGAINGFSIVTANQTGSFVLNSVTSSMLVPYVLNSRTGSFAITGSNTFRGTQTIGTTNTVQINTSGQITSNIGGDALNIYAGNILESNTLTVGAVSTVLLQSNTTGTPTVVYLDTAQHVGINTQTPTTELEVAGVVKATNFSGSLTGTATNAVSASYIDGGFY